MESQNPLIKRARLISPVWIIPLVALIIGAWLSVRAVQERGEEIVIIFNSANGIEVGKTEIRFKDVPVGRVTRIRLSDDLSKVRVFATLEKQMSQYLSENTQFWLVSPRVSASGVSNLGTLISGEYIVMDPGKRGDSKHVFEGLTEPPAVQSDEEGTQYVLTSDTLGSLDIGSPVYFKQIRVGEVSSYRLDDEGNKVDIRVFVKAPYDRFVLTRSRFWNVSGIDVSVSADGVSAEMGSLASLITGGVAFENVLVFDESARAKSNHVFYLYDDKDSLMEERYSLKYFYRLKFSHSVRGLNVGAPVEFRGLKVGAVEDVVLSEVANEPNSLHVYISLEPERLEHLEQPSREEFDRLLQDLVQKGLYAQLKTSSFITGSRYVDLVFPEDQAAGEFRVGKKYSEIPTIDHPSHQIDQQIADLMNKVNRIPLVALGEDLSASLSSLRQVLNTLEQANTAAKVDTTLENLSAASDQFDEAMGSLNSTLAQLSARLEEAESLTAPDSTAQYELRETLQAVKRAANAFNSLSETLQQQPSSLLFGREQND